MPFRTLLIVFSSFVLACGPLATDEPDTPQCFSDDDCDRTWESFCSTSGQTCVQCLEDAHCDRGFCNETGRCEVECVSHDACAGACDFNLGVCVACTEDAHCDGDLLCEDQSCIPGCTQNEDCSQGYCDMDSKLCVACLEDAHCSGDELCSSGTCLPDWSTYDPTQNTATRVTRFLIPTVVDNTPTCCKDYGSQSSNGRGTDNALAHHAAVYADLGSDLQARLDEALLQDRFVLLLDHWQLEGSDDPDFRFIPHEATPLGQSNFVLLDADNPPAAFDAHARLGNGMLHAQLLGTLELLLPLSANYELRVPVREVELFATPSFSDPGLSYTMGTLSGYVTVDDMFAALNRDAEEHCACLGLEGNDLFTFDPALGRWSTYCPQDVYTLCPDQPRCHILGGSDLGGDPGELCGFVPGYLPALADIDLDNDPDNGSEAISLGLEWTSAPATIVQP